MPRSSPSDEPAPRLVAPGLVLQRWRHADVGALTTAIRVSRDHLAPWLPWVAAYDQDPTAAAGFVDAVDRAWAERAEWSWGVWAGPALVGAVGLHSRGEPGVLEVGYWTHVDHTGCGVARRAAGAVTREALSLAQVRRVEIRHAATNHRSARVPARLGYRWVGRVPRGPGEGGGSDATVVWGMDAEDLDGVHPAGEAGRTPRFPVRGRRLLPDERISMPAAVTVYWRPGCGFCAALLRGLERAGVEPDRRNIWEDDDAAAFVRSVADGNETVPTVTVGERAMVNPSVARVLDALAEVAPETRAEG